MIKLVFILIIYAIFISVGLFDSLLGVAWPEMAKEFGVAHSFAGVISMTIATCTIISSLQAQRITKKVGIGKLVLVSVFLTAIGLMGFAFSPYFFLLIFMALPLGLGAGAIDISLNDYVAINFKAHHMNWLHAFWGVGATVGPIIMGTVLNNSSSWRNGYFIIGGIQMVLVMVIFFSLPLWKQSQNKHSKKSGECSISLKDVLKQPGVALSLLSFAFYVGIEATINLWGSSFLIEIKSLSIAHASFMISTFFASLTVGRILSGFITFWLPNKKMLLLSEGVLLMGLIIVAFGSGFILFGGFILIGLGCAAIFPTMLHETPKRFGEENSSRIMGLQVASGYGGVIVLPPLLGVLLQRFSMILFPIFLVGYALILLLGTFMIAKKTAKTDE